MNRWINAEKRRDDQVDLVWDLFGDWTLILAWGGLESRRGRMRVVYVSSSAEGLERIESIAKRGQQRGYQRPSPFLHADIT